MTFGARKKSPASDTLVDRLAEKVRPEIKRRKARATITTGECVEDRLTMPVVHLSTALLVVLSDNLEQLFGLVESLPTESVDKSVEKTGNA
ncbi:MAG: hypothetical protein HKN98_09740 [Silicimonas sp.]|nr:hypothetical protein [Silicimonas sp.]NND42619.1 hypothetical protein [Silicimonas sp.]